MGSGSEPASGWDRGRDRAGWDRALAAVLARPGGGCRDGSGLPGPHRPPRAASSRRRSPGEPPSCTTPSAPARSPCQVRHRGEGARCTPGSPRAGVGAGAEPHGQRSPVALSHISTPVSARYFDTKTTEPISFFLSSLEELLSWQPDGNDEFNVSAVPLAKRQPPLHSKRPRTLVCHDMRGGYLEDRCVLGEVTAELNTSNPRPLLPLIRFLPVCPQAGRAGGVWLSAAEQ